MTLKVYLRQLAFACYEASASDDPRVIELCVKLLIRSPLSIWEVLTFRPRRRIAA